MVVFACNHCGESVKKPAVVKHYLTKCRNRRKFISCMDCQKDFRDEEFNSHTSCISEAEKYSGKDYVPKPSLNAGLKRQENWLEIVRSILNSKDVDARPEVGRIFQRLQAYDNVPRKKDKFIKFLWNSMRVSAGQAEPVWQVVAVALEKFKTERQEAATSKIKSKTEEQTGKEVGNDAVKDSANAVAENETNGAAENETNGVAENETNGAEESKENGVTKKSKKKKKRSGEPLMEDAPPMKQRNEESGTDEAPSKKKHNDESVADEAPSKKKRSEEQSTEQSPPKKKKKSKHADQITNDEANVKTNDGIKFDWTNEIFSLVEKNDKQIGLDDLKKKIFKKYRKTFKTDEIAWKVEKTFNKKLRKSGLVVEDNVVKMTS